MTHRNLHFDVLKGIAIVMVIMGHVIYFGLGGHRADSSPLFWIISSLHMPLFAFVSGYFSTKPLDRSLRGVWSYWRSKVVRLLLPMLVLPWLYSCVKFGFIFGLPLGVHFAEYWFTISLFMVFVLFYLARYLSICLSPDRSDRIGDSLLTVILLGVICAIPYLTPLSDTSGVSNLINNTRWLSLFFLVGYLVARYPRLERMMRHELVASLAFVLYGALMLFGFVYQGGVPRDLSQLSILGGITSLGAITCTYYTVYHICTTSKASSEGWIHRLAYLGQVSLPIYLVHYFFVFKLQGVEDYLESIGSLEFTLGWEVLVVALGGIAVLMPTLLCIYIIRQNRYLSLLCFGEELRPRVRQS